MKKFFPAIALLSLAAIFSFSARAQENSDQGWEVKALNEVLPGNVQGQVDYDMAAGTARGTNGIFIRYGAAVLTADSAWLNMKTSDVTADGRVRIESGDQLWVGEHIEYNFKTGKLRSEQFRTGKAPIFAAGESFGGTIQTGTNPAPSKIIATNSFVTTDDISDPIYKIRASRITVIPGKSVQMWNAVVYVRGVPVFYFPYYQRNLGPRANNFTFLPGYRSAYGAYLLNTYNWYFGEIADGKMHLDYRTRRGVGVGPDINLHLDRWGNLALKYYYLHDNRPNIGTNNLPFFGNIPENRQRFYLGWQATPATNLNLKALVNYQSDPLVLHDFFEGDYRANPQPNTFIEANQYWDNWSLDALATPRVNSFFDQIGRLPDVRLTGFRQQIFDTPIYYDSQSSIGWYRSFVSNAENTNGFYPFTNGFYADEAMRADTFHQLTLPLTFFNWLHFEPRVGERFTYYSERSFSYPTNRQEVYRGIFNTGARVSFKATRLWRNATNSFLDVDGLRHIIEPSADYVFVPQPNTSANQLPQFDYEAQSLLLQPIDFPDYNNIDSIDAMNVVRFGLRNVLQTKRNGQLDDLVNWNLLLDWRLDPNPGQSPLNDLYSNLRFRPRSWLEADSQVRYDLDRGDLNLAFHQLTFTPDDQVSFGLGHLYLRGGAWGDGVWNENNFFTTTVFLRANDNWGFRATHDYNALNGRLQEQFYTLYRDLRSFTGALTFRVEDQAGTDPDYTISFSISLKASPATTVGEDAVNPERLVGE